VTEIMEPEIDDIGDVPDVNDADDKSEGNTGRCIVAIPAATEPVHHLGDVSEPKHMTMVWLGKPEDNPNLDMDQVRGQVEAVAERSGPLTGLVESTGQLGDDNASVWFLRSDGANEVRDDLLAQSYIKDGFGAVEQYPQWTPHVTAGYDMEEPLGEEETPDQIIFDKLAVWDGDEHTEYPLGPSGESTLPEGPEEAEFLAAMLKPLAINDAESLAAAVKECDGFCGTAQMATRPLLMKRARELSMQHLIPTDWIRQAASRVSTRHDIAVMAHSIAQQQDTPNLFQAKTELFGLSDTALRTAYMRGVREFTMTAPASRPPLPRDVVAQARVNSLIRLAQGDPSARTDDKDLLP
jgi:hypothetical protein